MGQADSPPAVELWLVDDPPGDADDPRLRTWHQLLDEDERARAARIVHDGARAEFVTARALLRTALTQASGDTVAPGAWRFAPNPWGRPGLSAPVPEAARGLRFNLSHTRGLVALALTRAPLELGVDVERTARRTRPEAIAHRYFAPSELEALLALPDEAARRARFFELWTLKEAYIKARGRGLAIPLREFAFDLAPGHLALTFAPEHDEQTPARWQCLLLAPTPDHQAALVIEHPQPFDAPAPVRTRWARELG